MEDEKFQFLLNELKDMRKEAKDEFDKLHAENSQRGERLVTIETNLKQVVGNGKRGIIDELKDQIKEHDEFIGDLKGAMKLAAWIGIPGLLGLLKHIFLGHAR